MPAGRTHTRAPRAPSTPTARMIAGLATIAHRARRDDQHGSSGGADADDRHPLLDVVAADQVGVVLAVGPLLLGGATAEEQVDEGKGLPGELGGALRRRRERRQPRPQPSTGAAGLADETHPASDQRETAHPRSEHGAQGVEIAPRVQFAAAGPLLQRPDRVPPLCALEGLGQVGRRPQPALRSPGDDLLPALDLLDVPHRRQFAGGRLIERVQHLQPAEPAPGHSRRRRVESPTEQLGGADGVVRRVEVGDEAADRLEPRQVDRAPPRHSAGVRTVAGAEVGVLAVDHALGVPGHPGGQLAGRRRRTVQRLERRHVRRHQGRAVGDVRPVDQEAERRRGAGRPPARTGPRPCPARRHARERARVRDDSSWHSWAFPICRAGASVRGVARWRRATAGRTPGW